MWNIRRIQICFSLTKTKSDIQDEQTRRNGGRGKIWQMEKVGAKRREFQ